MKIILSMDEVMKLVLEEVKRRGYNTEGAKIVARSNIEGSWDNRREVMNRLEIEVKDGTIR